MNKKRFFLLSLLVLLIMLLQGATPGPIKTLKCPTVQAGTVSGELSPEGYTVLLVDYPCDWLTPPVLVVSPSGQGSFWVERFEGNSLTGAEGSVAVYGAPGAPVMFSWVGVHE